MEIVYTRDDQSTRHICLTGRMTLASETLCGKIAYKAEPLALPVNCDECRTQNGQLNKARRNAPQSGYTHCACRDCMDTTVSSDTTKSELCTECKDAGCEPWRTSDAPTGEWYGATFECQRDDAYEG